MAQRQSEPPHPQLGYLELRLIIFDLSRSIVDYAKSSVEPDSEGLRHLNGYISGDRSFQAVISPYDWKKSYHFGNLPTPSGDELEIRVTPQSSDQFGYDTDQLLNPPHGGDVLRLEKFHIYHGPDEIPVMPLDHRLPTSDSDNDNNGNITTIS